MADRELYCVIDKNKRIQLIGTFDQCFNELETLRIILPRFEWRVEKLKNLSASPQAK